MNTPVHTYHKAILTELFHREHERLGDAILEAQATFLAIGHFPELLSVYHLLGDPALKLR